MDAGVKTPFKATVTRTAFVHAGTVRAFFRSFLGELASEV